VTDDRVAERPLAGRDEALERIGVTTVGFLAQVDVRCGVDAAERLGFPLEPNTVAGDVRRSVLWLAPDEWLVVGLPGTGGAAIGELDAALGTEPHSVIDVGASRVVLEMTNDDRLDLLVSVCSIDLDPRSWRPMTCAQTMLGRAQVILQELPEATRIFVRPSFAGYVADLLLTVAG
jgi:sarcosine oxidase, subunit gamma